MLSLTRSLAVEWSRHGVNVNGIEPGVFRTDLNAALLDGSPRGPELKMRNPMGRFGKAEELVGAAIYLASEARGYQRTHHHRRWWGAGEWGKSVILR